MCFENSESVLQDFKKMVANNLCSYEWYGNWVTEIDSNPGITSELSGEHLKINISV